MLAVAEPALPWSGHEEQRQDAEGQGQAYYWEEDCKEMILFLRCFLRCAMAGVNTIKYTWKVQWCAGFALCTPAGLRKFLGQQIGRQSQAGWENFANI
jgi:hypothetical protein